MKKLNIAACMFIAVTSFWGCKTVVAVRPPQPAVTASLRPPQPGPSYSWVEGEWYTRSGKYYRSQGSWVHASKGRNWIPGHWGSNRRGSYWVAGYWR